MCFIFPSSTDLEEGDITYGSDSDLCKLAFSEEEYEALVAEVRDVIGELKRDRDTILYLQFSQQ